LRIDGPTMTDDSDQEHQLRHRLRNVEAENLAMKALIRKAADQLEQVVESDCSAEEQVKALKSAERLRQASAGG
jgi:hypothetical protein